MKALREWWWFCRRRVNGPVVKAGLSLFVACCVVLKVFERFTSEDRVGFSLTVKTVYAQSPLAQTINLAGASGDVYIHIWKFNDQWFGLPLSDAYELQIQGLKPDEATKRTMAQFLRTLVDTSPNADLMRDLQTKFATELATGEFSAERNYWGAKILRLLTIVVATVLVASPVLVWVGYRGHIARKHWLAGRCSLCGYDPRGPVTVCPECGTGVPTALDLTKPPY